MPSRTLTTLLLASGLPLVAQNASLVNYWDFEDPDPFSDKRGTASSSVSPNTTVTTTAGVRGLNAMGVQASIGGDDDFLDIDGLTLFQPGEGAFSMSYWFRIPDDGVNIPRGIFDFSANGRDGVQSLFIDNFTNPNGEPSMAFRIDHANGGVSLDFVPVTEGEDWHFVAATYDPATGMSVHFDGFGVAASAPPVSLPNPVTMDPDSYLGSFNYTGATQIKGLAGDLDDLAIYRGVLSQSEIEGLFAGTLTPPEVAAPAPPPTPIGHYWDMDTMIDITPVDLYGNLSMSIFGFVTVETNPLYGAAYAGAGASLNTVGQFGDHLIADTFQDGSPIALDFGKKSFALSFWTYDDTSDGEAYGATVFDFLLNSETGLELGTEANGNFRLHLADDEGNEVISNTVPGFENLKTPADQWVHVVLNLDRANGLLQVFFNGAPIPEGSLDVSILTGNIFCTQDLVIGVVGGGIGIGTAQDCGLDDFSIYPGTLSPQQVSDLAANTVGPLDLLATFEIPSAIPVVSLDYNQGDEEITISFSTVAGATYSVYGGENLDEIDTWPEISALEILGDGGTHHFGYVAPGAPAEFFLQVRED